MNTVIIACKTLEDELEFASGKTGIVYPVIWIESGLHSSPKKLNARLCEILDCVKAQRVLLAMGFCGNAIQNIQIGNFELIVPRVDDCISLLIGSIEERIRISKEFSAYFLTDGWLRGERNLWVEYLYALEKFGEEEARNIAKAMYGHYRTLGLLNNNITPIEMLVENTKIIAETLNLEQRVIPATTSYIEDLLKGPWPDDRFIVKRPGEVLSADSLIIDTGYEGGAAMGK